MKSPRTYTLDEKQKATRRALEAGPSVASRELGIPSGTLSCWAHKARQGKAGFAVPPTEEVEQNISAAESSRAPSSQPPAKPRVARVYTPSEKARALERVAALGVTAASRELGISRYSLYDWRRRVQRAAEGKGDSPTSGPDPADIEAQRDREILEMWKTHPGLGPSQIRNQLRRSGVKVATGTVRKVMEDAGYRPPKRKTSDHTRRYESIRPNHIWHLDFVQRYINRASTFTLTMATPKSFGVSAHQRMDSVRQQQVDLAFVPHQLLMSRSTTARPASSHSSRGWIPSRVELRCIEVGHSNNRVNTVRSSAGSALRMRSAKARFAASESVQTTHRMCRASSTWGFRRSRVLGESRSPRT